MVISTRGGRIDLSLGCGEDQSIPLPVLSAPTLSVVGASSSELLATWTPGAIDWSYIDMEVYEDAGLTILNQAITQFVLSGATSLFVESLDPDTQYWVRMRVSNNGGSAYSDWSNTATGTTNSDLSAEYLTPDSASYYVTPDGLEYYQQP